MEIIATENDQIQAKDVKTGGIKILGLIFCLGAHLFGFVKISSFIALENLYRILSK